MAQISSLFVTRLYHGNLHEAAPHLDLAELEQSCLVIAEDDEAGRTWCEEKTNQIALVGFLIHIHFFGC